MVFGALATMVTWTPCRMKAMELLPNGGSNSLGRRVMLRCSWERLCSGRRREAQMVSITAHCTFGCFICPTAGPEPSSCPFFVYTSNVDGHFRRFFSGREILEIHGSTDFWQCAAPCCSEVWTLPTTFRFDVDCDALTTAPNASHPAIVGQVKQISHYAAEPQLVISEKPPVVCGIPACIHCGNEARPNVLMFCDDGVVCSAFAESHYVEWECAMEAVLADQLPECCQVANGCDNGPRWVPGGLVIIEMGCGKNVPSVRQETENVLSDINRRAAEYGVAQCLLVRINPDFPNADHRKDPAVAHHVIGIRATALQALKAIDVHLQALLAQRT
eukprot:GGOE01018919.1.p1 GENE.GGOE01018919.1~~GGOE01018919.1.p1  ORF type:complete len:331 (-),score=37.89 GGOE01018919.1:158-1150(-)